LDLTLQNQLFTIQSRTEEEAAGMQGELEIATTEMERAQQRLVALEAEKAALERQVGCVA
jgi:homeobox protein cut-like